MSKRTEEATELFSEGCNCSQCVSSVFAEKYGVSKEDMLRLSCGFGAGMKNGEVCGAVTGAIMVIGMKYGVGQNNEQKELCYNKTVEFTKCFREKNGSIVCRDLLGIDISSEENRVKARELNLFKTVCVDMIISAIELLEELGY